MHLTKITIISTIFILFLNSCGGYKYSSSRDNPVKGADRARKNVEEGRGVSVGKALKNRGGTTYEFSSSNPMWRASLEILDFMPLSTVDYSGGMIVSDWYTDGSQNNESIKITIRFLSTEVRSDSVKVIVHKKKCQSDQTCRVAQMTNSIIVRELQSSILREAAKIEIEQKKKK
jgi:hypothetical protein|tara:strand:- start:160 stop:681 length:522 start_codon:yes stop_codon:yes gene_type:complete